MIVSLLFLYYFCSNPSDRRCESNGTRVKYPSFKTITYQESSLVYNHKRRSLNDLNEYVDSMSNLHSIAMDEYLAVIDGARFSVVGSFIAERGNGGADLRFLGKKKTKNQRVITLCTIMNIYATTTKGLSRFFLGHPFCFTKVC